MFDSYTSDQMSEIEPDETGLELDEQQWRAEQIADMIQDQEDKWGEGRIQDNE